MEGTKKTMGNVRMTSSWLGFEYLAKPKSHVMAVPTCLEPA